MTAKEARISIQKGCDVTSNITSVYEYIQSIIKAAVVYRKTNCICMFPVVINEVIDGRFQSIPTFPKIEEAINLLIKEGFEGYLSQCGGNWQVEVRW